MGGCVSKGKKDKDPDKAPYGEKETDDKDKAADDTKAQETTETPAKTEDTADKDAEKENDDAESKAKEEDKKDEPVSDNQVVIKVGNADGPENKSVSVSKEVSSQEVTKSSSSSAYTKEEVRSFGKSTMVTTEVESSSSGGELSAQAQELIDKFRREGPDAIEGVVKTMSSSSERKVVSSVTSSSATGDGPPKVESVTTTSHSLSKTDPEGKTTKESTTTTEMKGVGPNSAILDVTPMDKPAIRIEVSDESKKEGEAPKA